MLHSLKAVALATLLASVGCAKADSAEVGPVETEVSGTLSDVRITASVASTEHTGNALGGAIVGGMVAGKMGAIVGAAAGSDANRTMVVGKILACSFRAKMSDSTVVLFTVLDGYSEFSAICSLQREGDRKVFAKQTSMERNGRHVTYEWIEPSIHYLGVHSGVLGQIQRDK